MEKLPNPEEVHLTTGAIGILVGALIAIFGWIFTAGRMTTRLEEVEKEVRKVHNKLYDSDNNERYITVTGHAQQCVNTQTVLTNLLDSINREVGKLSSRTEEHDREVFDRIRKIEQCMYQTSAAVTVIEKLQRASNNGNGNQNGGNLIGKNGG